MEQSLGGGGNQKIIKTYFDVEALSDSFFAGFSNGVGKKILLHYLNRKAGSRKRTKTYFASYLARAVWLLVGPH